MGLFYFYFRLFNTVDSKHLFNINLANDWIRTAYLSYRKRSLYQLSHNHCPIKELFGEAVTYLGTVYISPHG